MSENKDGFLFTSAEREARDIEKSEKKDPLKH